MPSHRSTPTFAINRDSESGLVFSLAFYLLTTLLYGGGEFAHYHIYTLQCGLLQLLDLLFHYGLKSQVRGEQPRPVGIGRRHGEKSKEKEKKRKEKKKKTKKVEKEEK